MDGMVDEDLLLEQYVALAEVLQYQQVTPEWRLQERYSLKLMKLLRVQVASFVRPTSV